MELKDYQKKVVEDIDRYGNLSASLKPKEAFRRLWLADGIDTNASHSDFFHPYCNDMGDDVPNVTVKVPTAGGKTFIACNAIDVIFRHFDEGKTKAVAWFVPSDSILEQTKKNLEDTHHPYRQCLDVKFQGRVNIYDKAMLLQGQNFDPQIVNDNLSIFVLSIQSFASNTKDARLVHRQNSSMQKWESELGYDVKDAENHPSLMEVIQSLNPVVIIDESHNFTSSLRTEFLKELKPCFILNLTATPREKSNIISFVSARELKKNNMVKLPVVLYNLEDKKDVVTHAINLRDSLEERARAMEEQGGEFVRPIVLFQAESKTDKDKATFEKVKEFLKKCGIAEEEIKIKTAEINELKGINLMSKECKVRYIITVNALKEGWDCPFAYILASLANRTSRIDVEQILGRVLRQPYAMRHSEDMLNMSYVFSCSSDFQHTIDSVVRGLQGAGFTRRDYRLAEVEEMAMREEMREAIVQNPLFGNEPMPYAMFNEEERVSVVAENTNLDDIDIEAVKASVASGGGDSVKAMEQTAKKIAEQMESEKDKDDDNPIVMEQEKNSVSMRGSVREIASGIVLPQFHFKSKSGEGFFEDEEEDRLLYRERLSEGFNLDVQNKEIDLINTGCDNVRAFDITGEDDYVLKKVTMSEKQRSRIFELFERYNKEQRVSQLSGKIVRGLNYIYIPEPSLMKYVQDVLNGYSAEQILEFVSKEEEITMAFRQKINGLMVAHWMAKFEKDLDSEKIYLKESYVLPEKIILPQDRRETSFAKTLYTAESKDMNEMEMKVASLLSRIPNVEFWHRNMERGKGFYINGFINHYPDFIVRTESGKTIMIETKGEHLKNDDSKSKLSLGNTWVGKAGGGYRYYMVFDGEPIEGGVTVNEMVEKVKLL